MNDFIQNLKKGTGAPLILMLILGMIVVPLPPAVLDLLFVVNIVISVSVLMACVYAKKPLDFSIFPTVLLMATMMRLSLNIASTRVILLNGGNGAGGAGQVIESFGNFVIGGNYIVGLVVFIILTIINFVVITKGAERISEVGARFTLDSMPGKQMAVDADLGSGQITHEEAADRRKEIGAESQFHGNMDGASKFVKGDSIAGILILFINIIGGLTVGVVQNDMSVSDALSTFTLLSIGDGLVAILPSIIMALATAIIITRVTGESELTEMVGKQLFSNPMIPVMTGAIISCVGLIPQMPNILFLSVGGALIYFGYYINKNKTQEELTKATELAKLQKDQNETNLSTKPKEVSLDDISEPELVTIELGFSLADIAKGMNSPLVTATTGLRKKLSKEFGVVIKGFYIIDSADLEPNDYKIYMSGIERGHGTVFSKLVMALSNGDDTLPVLKGKPAKEPVFGLDGFWILDSEQANASDIGYTVIDPATMITTHIEQCILKNLPLMVDLDDLQKMVDKVAIVKPKLVEAALSNANSLTLLLRLVRELLKERVSVSQLSIILETMAEMSDVTITFADLVMHIRKRLGPWILSRIVEDSSSIKVIMLTDELQNLMNQGLQLDGSIFIDHKKLQSIEQELKKTISNLNDFNYPAILVVNPALRRGLFDLFGSQLDDLHILDFLGIPKETNIEIVTTIN